MPPANHHGKPQLDKAALDLLKQMIPEIEEEGIRLNYLEAEFEQAKLRGETPDPSEVAKVQTAQAALVQRCDTLKAHMLTMGQEADACTQAANAVIFEALRHQFNERFGPE